MMIYPRGDRVLVKREAADGITKGGIILPDSSKDKQQKGSVAAVDLQYQQSIEGKKLGLRIGDVVLFTRFSGEGFKPEDTGDDLLLVKDDDVIAILVYGPEE